MSVVDEVAVHLAERIAPESADLAPLYAEAAVAGRLDETAGLSKGAVLGGFGLDQLDMLFQVMGALSACVTIVDFVIARGAARASTRAATEVLTEQLVARGLSRQQAAQTSSATLAALAEIPDKADAFLDALRRAKG